MVSKPIKPLFHIKNKKMPFDMVLMDCEMPVMDGFEATQSIRDWEKRNKLSETSIVALSAHILPQQKALCMDSGMNDYIEKPIELSTLRNKLMEWAPPIVNSHDDMSPQLSTNSK